MIRTMILRFMLLSCIFLFVNPCCCLPTKKYTALDIPRQTIFGSALEFTSECSKKIGIDRAEHARERQVLVFEPTSEEGSTLTCAGNNYGKYCMGGNVVLNTAALTRRDHGSQDEKKEFYHSEYSAFILAGGQLKGQDYIPKLKKKTIQRDFLEGIKKTKDTVTCQEWIEHPVYMPIRNEYANVFFSLIEMYNAFVAGYVFDSNPDDWQTIFLDAHGPSPQDGAWKSAFSAKHPLLRLENVREKYEGKNVCFRNVLFNPAPYDNEVFKTDHFCPGNPLYHQFRNYLLDSLKIAPTISLPSYLPTITFLWRKDYQSHPRMSGLITRKLVEEDKIRSMLQEGSGFIINHVDFARMTFEEQVEVMGHTDIFIANHGAGISMALFAKPTTTVVEIIPSISYSFLHRVRYMGLRYRQLPASKVVGKKEKDTYVDVEAMQSMIDSLLRSYRSPYLFQGMPAKYAFCGLCKGIGEGPVVGFDYSIKT